MKKWFNNLIVLLFFGIFGWALGWSIAFGLHYEFTHQWNDPNNTGIELLIVLPAILAKNLLHGTSQGVSNSFFYETYGFFGFCLCIAFGIVFLSLRNSKKSEGGVR